MAASAEIQRARTRSRVILVAALLALGYMGVGARLVWLQIIRHDFLALRAARQQQEVVEIPARRGTIYDRNGRELAVSIDTDSLYAVPASIGDPGDAAKKLAPALGMDVKAVKAKLDDGKRFVWLARKVSPDVPDRIKAVGDFGGALGWLADSRRYYPKKELASHVLGFTGMDNKGLEGLEAEYEQSIGGVAGKAITERDGTGREVLSVDEARNSPKPGSDLVLTLDENIQYVAEKELDGIMEKFSPISATAIVMDPRTGEILALANRPCYNPNNFKDASPSKWRDRAVTDLYEPGSTFKIITASAALEEKVIKPGDIVDCGDGMIELGGRTIHSAHNEGGRLTFTQVIQKSNNVGTIKVAMRLGADRLYKYAKAFGIGEKTGVDLPGEVSGRLKEVKYWSGTSIGCIPIGQEVDVTALQMLTVLNCVANGGWYVQPYVVSEIKSADGTKVSVPVREKPRRVISEATAKTLTGILCDVVEDGGTAVQANVKGWQVAGKTGTAQKYDPAIRRYSQTKFMSSFVGFVPAENPRLSCIVVVNEPKGQHYGGSVAGPAFRNIVEQSLTYLKVPTRLPEQTLLVERR